MWDTFWRLSNLHQTVQIKVINPYFVLQCAYARMITRLENTFASMEKIFHASQVSPARGLIMPVSDIQSLVTDLGAASKLQEMNSDFAFHRPNYLLFPTREMLT